MEWSAEILVRQKSSALYYRVTSLGQSMGSNEYRTMNHMFRLRYCDLVCISRIGYHEMHSVFDLFKVGVGPSSSHTVGPMLAAKRFVDELTELQCGPLERVGCDLYGALALTGKGHATDDAVLTGLMGQHPATVEIEAARQRLAELRSSEKMEIPRVGRVEFIEKRDVVFHFSEFLPFHPNALKLTAWTSSGSIVLSRTFYSVGGGFVLRDDETDPTSHESKTDVVSVPFPYASCHQLMSMCHTSGLTIDQIVLENERTWRPDEAIYLGLDLIWDVMKQSMEKGMVTGGTLPGGLNVKRRAPDMAQKLNQEGAHDDPLRVLDWVSLFALAVNEENAAGGRVVTAPTNGAAGIIPAVLAYYERFVSGADRSGVHRFLLTSAAIGLLYKRNASLSAAEMGCQGEVGVACSMAAAGLAACLGGSVSQIENAAEIGMEHHLGLTCDPISGLVQIPCIERNTMGAAKAINAARLAVLYGDGSHRVPLDKVIETMRQTGVDMQSKYKETSLGGLAVNVVDC